jgi:enhancer of mRNA-decapping protein 3
LNFLVTETGPNDEQMIENGGRNTAMMVLQAWGSRRLQRSNHNVPPLVVVLAGNNKTGAMALAAGRQLANREVRVMAFVVSEDESLGLNNVSSSYFSLK